jgi:tetratricopeptide (TPR) repeat protein
VRWWWLWVTLLALWLPSATASAEELPDYFAKGVAALEEGRFEDAIAQLEAFADRMPPHPDASYNRGLAYLMRVKNEAEKPGDLGRAAAAFEEALSMRPDDPEAARAVELVQGEVARRRSRRGKDVVLARPTLDRVVIRLASESTWGIGAILGSLILAIGLVLRRREGSQHVAGIVLTPIGLVLLAALLPLYMGARHLRLNRKAGVLVAREAYLSDDTGARLGGDAIPEAAKVEVGERRGRMLEVRYGAVEGWLPADTVRVLRVR